MTNLEVASSYAQDIDNLILLIGAMVGFWFVLVSGVFFWLIFKFRHKEGQKGQYIAGETKSEKKWVTWPHILVLVCDVFIIWAAVKVWVDVKQDLPPAEAEVRIIGQQWSWTFQHPGPDNKLDTPDDVFMTDELHVKVDTVYHFHLQSRDVLHDFSVPVFRLKQDSVPGRTITGWFKPTKTGEHDIQCAEMCGIGHGLMKARIFIETPEKHASWLTDQASKLALNIAPTGEESDDGR